MKTSEKNRRAFLKSTLTTAAAVTLTGAEAGRALAEAAPAGRVASPADQASTAKTPGTPRIKFAAIGLNHNHINGQCDSVIRGGGELVSFFAKEPDLAAAFAKRYPQAKLARSAAEILEDKSIQLVVSAAIPDERAPLGVQAMRHGKDFMADKPGMTTLAQLAEARRVQAETKRIYAVLYGERLENKATIRAGELVKAGAIGKVIQTIGLGPHRMSPKTRPAWFFEKAHYGGILCDIASHQFEQFLFFTGSTDATIVASQVRNVNHPEYPGLEDFGDAMVRGNGGGTGYVRVDWFTPDGLNTWGDGRLTVIGTEGFLEIRKNVDIGGRTGGSHLFLVDQKETRYIDSTDAALTYGEKLVDDVLNRTETAMTQAHTFKAMELALTAEQQAQRVK